MSNNKIALSFLLQKAKVNRKGKCPIKCRIIYKKEKKEFAIGYSIEEPYWDSKMQEGISPSEDFEFINTQLSLIKTKINQAFLFLQVNNPDFDVNDLYNQYLGKSLRKDMGLIEVYDEYLNRIHKLIDKEIKLVTYNKYKESKVHLVDFIYWNMKTKDVKLNALKSNFVTDYEYFLKTEKNFQTGTIYKAIQRFRKVVRYAVGNDYLAKDPFMLYKSLRPKKELVYLTNKELRDLEDYDFAQSRLEQVRDMFVFCCYTGLAFKEMSNLRQQNIISGFDGNKWISMKREKTNKEISIPLLPNALKLLDKLSQTKESDMDWLLPSISNQKFNSYLKEIAAVVGITKNLTHHLARKTFATTVLLYNDVPMEIVSELLGHSKMSITQEHYGKVVQKKVSEHMQNLTKRLSSKE
ncbi:site-specific integrase [Flavobacterium beibuense]|uniref:Tyrosine type site-specific recombinase n=1 Tax=Flavobacterium beibuense TaxID=657326 RepID=A0A444WBS8_9FLAO|nr:site-specific integrase [Flavobacterium beibuense]RYJ43272.1 Tyrosine type site-specific recombinase [Flavobacterium beibuense]